MNIDILISKSSLEDIKDKLITINSKIRDHIDGGARVGSIYLRQKVSPSEFPFRTAYPLQNKTYFTYGKLQFELDYRFTSSSNYYFTYVYVIGKDEKILVGNDSGWLDGGPWQKQAQLAIESFGIALRAVEQRLTEEHNQKETDRINMEAKQLADNMERARKIMSS